MRMQDMRIPVKIAMAFAIIVLGVVISGGVAINRLAALNTAAAAVGKNALPSVKTLGEIKASLVEMRRLELSHIANSDPLKMADIERAMADVRKAINTGLAKYKSLVSSGVEQGYYDNFKSKWDGYDAMEAPILELSRAAKLDEARDLQLGLSSNYYREMLKFLDDDIALNDSDATKAVHDFEETYTLSWEVQLISIVIVAILSVFFALMFRSGVAVPIVAMTDSMRALAAGNKQIEIPGRGRKDEIGDMADAVQVFKDNAILADRLSAEQAEQQRAREARSRALEALTGTFDGKVTGVLGIVAGASAELEATAQSMSSTAQQTVQQATAVASTTQDTTVNIQTVASAAEELSASISEIGRQVAQSSKVSLAASDEAARSNETVKGLAESSGKIGAVVSLINDIASQTNLLALNATIEAARAGDAGKGFAVVANEVKALANQTTRATEEIGIQIGAVQSATAEAVIAIGSIAARVTELNQIAASIATAVEEQSAATNEIARNIQQSAAGAREVSNTIGSVTSAAGETGSAAGEVLSAARSLSREATELRDIVGTFLKDVNAA